MTRHTCGMGRPSDEVIMSWVQERTQRTSQLAESHQMALDRTSALAIAIASFVGLAAQGRLHHPDVIVFCFALPAPLALRRFSCRASFGLVAFIALVQWFTSTPQLSDAAVLVALFWLARDGGVLEMGVAGLVVEVGAIMAAARWSPTDPAKVWVGITGLGVAAGVLGVSIRQRRTLVESLHERAARLEFERDQEGRLGAAAERARIAREMHDIVSHNLTVMIGLADGAGYALESSPETALTAMQSVSATGRQALLEMRRLLGVLRDEPESESYEPQPGLDRLDDLLARVEAAGTPVSIEMSGDPHELSGGVQLTVFRVAQEALTNTLKHAGRPASAHLALSCHHGRIELEVTDTGGLTRPEREQAVPAGGRGLRGMRERAAAYGGHLEAGPVAQGGWRVHLSLSSEVDSPVS
jgi:signal transduction histidine kinase